MLNQDDDSDRQKMSTQLQSEEEDILKKVDDFINMKKNMNKIQ